uniref:Uncharacterized protein n=1 Tax=virus sp. ctIVh9 TaxID=2826797 RepID=A0A8S5R7Q8_9VIRU|nr:MAG TPA: hypothetical protein [virus sp. ctIVh9]
MTSERNYHSSKEAWVVRRKCLIRLDFLDFSDKRIK